MNNKDEKISKEILKVLYDHFNEEPIRSMEVEELYQALEQFSNDDITYVAKRIDQKYVDIGKGIGCIHITAEGIDRLFQLGYQTLLGQDTRYEILGILYKFDREHPREILERKDLVEEMEVEPTEIDKNVWYLREKQLIETKGGGSGKFYHLIKITRRGKDKYEAYQNDGVEIPSTGQFIQIHQTTIGPNEHGKAENLFRDFVELAKDQVIVIDPFAREKLYTELLKHVPSPVEINVITSDQVAGSERYKKIVAQFKDNHEKTEVRYLEKRKGNGWPFHGRSVIRDREEGWNWDHSFHDAGKTQHTVSEIKPVNLKKILDTFDIAWEEGGSVIKNEG